jgi:hypothetical protein
MSDAERKRCGGMGEERTGYLFALVALQVSDEVPFHIRRDLCVCVCVCVCLCLCVCVCVRVRDGDGREKTSRWHVPSGPRTSPQALAPAMTAINCQRRNQTNSGKKQKEEAEARSRAAAARSRSKKQRQEARSRSKKQQQQQQESVRRNNSDERSFRRRHVGQQRKRLEWPPRASSC